MGTSALVLATFEFFCENSESSSSYNCKFRLKMLPRQDDLSFIRYSYIFLLEGIHRNFRGDAFSSFVHQVGVARRGTTAFSVA